MNRSLGVVALLAGALTLSACPPRTDGAFDVGGLPDGQYMEPYSGELAVADYDGAVRFTLVSGELVEGLEFNEAGVVSGTPEYARRMTLTVLASGMSGVEDFQDTVTFTIGADEVEGAFLGYDHDQVNNMTELQQNLMRDIWVRASGGGADGFDLWTMNPGIYLPGPNGIAEDGQDDEFRAGLYDDVRIGDVEFADLDLDFSSWEANEETFINPPDYPSQHTPDGDPPTVSGDGTVHAGSDTGGARLTLTHPDLGEVSPRVMVVPPDWCPAGEHPEGGWTEGFCI